MEPVTSLESDHVAAKRPPCEAQVSEEIQDLVANELVTITQGTGENSIVSDHHGFIRVRDNVPRGSRFVMEFPVRRPTLQLAVGATPVAYGA